MTPASVAAPFIVLSDLHLYHGHSETTLRAFTELVERSAGREIVLNGDAFALSNDPKERDPIESVRTFLAEDPRLVAALRAHLSSGARLTFIAGNHDAAIGGDAMRQGILSLLELQTDAKLTVEPWFIRRGVVHVEHGHLWDPDNAPVHPLSAGSPLTEPLGIQLTRRFVARHEVWEFAHAHETTLVAGISRAFTLFGPRAPLLVARYFAAASQICVDTLLERGIGEERARGEALLEGQTIRSGVDAATLHALIARAPTPTHTRFETTFFRLYFDRVLAAVGLSGGALGFVLRRSPAAALLALASGAYLGVNVKASGARYQNLPIRRLREGAGVVQAVTRAGLVVFGHTHVAEIGDGYANAGSFGYPPQDGRRPYLVVDPDSGKPEFQSQG